MHKTRPTLFFAATLLFFTSATAVQFAGVRLSDFSVVAFYLLVLLLTPRHLSFKYPIKNIFVPSLLLGAILLSTSIQVLFAPSNLIIEGYNNLVAIPIGIFLAFFLFIKIAPDDQLNILYNYNIIAIVMSLTLYFLQYIYGAFVWIEIVDETNRFSALSLNPNQLGIYLLVIPFFALTQVAFGKLTMPFASIQILLSILINYLSFGKALFTSWVVGFLVIGLLGIYGSVKVKNLFIKISILLVIALFSIAFLSSIIDALYSGSAPGSVDGQGDARVTLWTNGLSAWLETPLFGHGPGHYSGLFGPYESLEAHNLIIDWLSAYGAVGTAVLIAMFSVLFRKAFISKFWVIFGMYLCLITQSMFHFYGRQPIYWIWWAVGLTICEMFSRHEIAKYSTYVKS